MIAVSVRRAWRTAGSRKALTPLLTASTPVMAVQPLAKARISDPEASAVAAAMAAAAAARPAPGVRRRASALTTPMASTAQQRDDEQVSRHHEGHARLARRPRRLTTVISARIARQRAQRVRAGATGTAETRAPDAGRDADGHDQDVVEHERRRGEQARRSCPGSPWPRCTTRRRADRPRSSAGRRSRRSAAGR